VLSVCAVYVFTKKIPPIYQAFATLEVQTNEDAVTLDTFNPNSDPAEYLSTQLFRLRSRTLIESVVDQDGFEQRLKFNNSGFSQDLTKKEIVDRLIENLDVSYLGDSRILKVSFQNLDPNLVAYVPNTIVKTFEVQANAKDVTTSEDERAELEVKLTNTKEKLEASELILAKYAKQKDLLRLPNSREGGDLSTTTESENLQSLKEDARLVKSRRIELQREYDAYIEGPSHPSLADVPSLKEIQDSRQVLMDQYESDSKIYREEYPDMLVLKQQIANADAALEREFLRLFVATQARLDDAIANEESLKSRINDATRKLNRIREATVKYDRLRRDVQSTRVEYDGLLERFQNLVSESNQTLDRVSVLDLAKPPSRPIYPNIIKNLLWAGFGASLFSLLSIFLLSITDDRISSPDDVVGRLGLPLLGVIPKFKGKNIISDLFNNPLSIASESYSTTRTKIEMLNDGKSPPQCIQVTSTRAGEGKSVTSMALARSYAVIGHKTLLIDADLRLPSFQGDDSSTVGLAGVLLRGWGAEKEIRPTKLNDLYLLEAGKEPEDPSRLLASDYFLAMINELRGKYDRIVVDGPPVLGLSDALLLGQAVDGTIIVTQSNALPARAVLATITRMAETGKDVLGVVITKYKTSHGRHSYHYSKYTYGKKAMEYGKKTNGILGQSKEKKKINLG